MAGAVRTSELVCWPELGCEAVRRLEVEDFPLTVVVDPQGNDLYELGPQRYLESLPEKT
jgi:fumarate hydratase subunit beta